MNQGAPDDAKARRDARKVRWGILLGRPLVKLLGWTWRVEEGPSAAWDEHRRSGKGFLIATWHGLLLPRQETAFGRRAWLVSGLGWLVFHVPFGPVILLTLWPTVFIIPYAVQRRQNTWIGVVVHAGLNGPGFLAVAFGLV